MKLFHTGNGNYEAHHDGIIVYADKNGAYSAGTADREPTGEAISVNDVEQFVATSILKAVFWRPPTVG